MKVESGVLRAGWAAAVAGALAVRGWNALEGPLMYGYDAWGHVAYALFLDLYGALPWSDQGWSYFHPPLHYGIGWGLAQLGSSEALLRGLAVWGGVASLAVAALAASLTRVAAPKRPALALAAFCSVAFLPVHLYTSPMSGNELTAALFASAALATLVANERRGAPTLLGDALTGLAVALALLSKFSGALVLATAGIVLLASPRRAAAPPRLARLAVLGAVVLVIAGPWYARNLGEYGTPVRLSRADPLVAEVEGEQPPGERPWRDFFSLSPRLLADPDPGARHLIHSVWGSLYTHVWVDARGVWMDAAARSRDRIRRAGSAMALLGLLPTALALLGAVLAALDLCRGRRVVVYLPLLTCAGLSLASFVAFAVAVPTFAALKASYLLGTSLAWAAFLARGLEALAVRSRPLAGVASAFLVAAWLGAAAVASPGLVLPALPESALVGPVRLYFGEDDRARALYRKLLLGNRAEAAIWIENLSAVELVAGEPARARAVQGRRAQPTGEDAWSANQLGVSTALSGDREAARRLFDLALERGGGAVALANRGALRAASGDPAGAADDLREATALDPNLVPAWHALAWAEERAGQAAASEAARREATLRLRAAPRGHPYGLGAGLGQRANPRIGRRWLLWFDGDSLRASHAPARDGW